MSKTYQIAVLAGDGIGKEVMPEGLRATMAAAKRFGLDLQLHTFAWASCDYYAEHGKMMPDDWKAQLSGMDAIFFGAVGWPATVPDHVSLWGSLLKFRREFDQYINLRPVRLFEGVPCPLAGRKPGDIDYYVVRENTEGEYTSLGGVMSKAPTAKSSSRNPSTRATAPTACSSSLLTWPRAAPRSTSPWPPRATASPSACPGGTSARTMWPKATPRSRWTSSTSTS